MFKKAKVKKGLRLLFWRLLQIVGLYPNLQIKKTSLKLKKVGSENAGWTVVDDQQLNNSHIISLGLGEDGSFDLSMNELYNCDVSIVDPTKRAVDHYENILRVKNKKFRIEEFRTKYGFDFNSDKINWEKIKLIQIAGWNKNENVKFYKPKNAKHVSHSIVNYQFNYSNETDFILVQADTIKNIIENNKLEWPELIKYDIEGAEIETILQMIHDQIYPNQILVEYDEIIKPSLKGTKRIEKCHQVLTTSGYSLIHKDFTDFLYVKSKHFNVQ